jgi:carbon-monoxide dehydrogenase medium subunit/xanthine dehydrogenase FAD-binding subunit
MLTCDEYVTPTSLLEALELLAQNEGRCRMVAGATDLLPWAREGRAGDVHLEMLVDISKVPELRGYSVSNGHARLGATTPFQRFLDDPALREALPGMPRCAIWFADDQIRESATLGGNLVNASPAGDSLPPLLAADAIIDIASLKDGRVVRRAVPMQDFVIGPGLTALGKNEILMGIDAEATPDHGGAFEKVGHRRSLVISVACVSALVKLDSSGQRFDDVRLAIGGVGPVPKRLRDIESALSGARVSAGAIAAAARMGVDYVRSRSRVEYRRAVVPGLIGRAVTAAAQAAGAHPDAIKDLREALHA